MYEIFIFIMNFKCHNIPLVFINKMLMLKIKF